MTKYTIHYEDGRVSKGMDIVEAALITGLDAAEIEWACEEDGQCAVEDTDHGEVIVVPE